MAERFAFTKAAIEALEPPKQGRVLVHDTKVRGLAMRVTPAGAKSAYVYRKHHGRPLKVFICKWPDLTIEQIRKQAEAINARLAKGENPSGDRRAARKVHTLGELWDWWLENHAKPHKRSWPMDEWQWERFLKTSWAPKRLTDISPADLQALHAKIGRDVGHIPANRLRSLLHSLFEVAKKDLGFAGDNPVKAVKRFDEQPRERYLGPDELPKLLAALDAEPNEMLADFFRLALYTGGRRGNLQSARWEEFDLRVNSWTIPAEKAKAKKPIRIPLAAEALAVLIRRKAATKGSPWVFPSRGKAGHLTEPKGAWKRICAAAGLTNVRLHDLRHTTASWMVAGGASLYVVGKVLGHANQKSTQRYAHLELNDLRTALGGATAAMKATAKPKKKAHRK